jgi:diphthine synthase
MVESQAEEIYGQALDTNVGFLVVGDPLCATTHVDLILRAKALGIVVEVSHKAWHLHSYTCSGTDRWRCVLPSVMHTSMLSCCIGDLI